MKKEITKLAEFCTRKRLTLCTAESCTGGMISGEITSLPGVSGFFLGGVVSYSNAIKENVIGVSGETLKKHGAVSAETAIEMASGVRALFKAGVSVSVTGIAGPDGGTKRKPVGTVFIAVSRESITTAWLHNFKGTRSEIRRATVKAALGHLSDVIGAMN